MNKQEIKAWLKSHHIHYYKISDDLTVDVDGSVDLTGENLTELPFQFGIIKGFFTCHNNKLTSLKHCPKVVHGGFSCSHNKLTSLEHCLKEVHDGFSCDSNKLTSLEHCPKVVHGGFYCDDSLKKDPRYLRWLLAKKLKEL